MAKLGTNLSFPLKKNSTAIGTKWRWTGGQMDADGHGFQETDGGFKFVPGGCLKKGGLTENTENGTADGRRWT